MPGPAVEVKPPFVVRAVVAPIALPPALIIGIVLCPAEGPHIVEGPHHGLAKFTNIRNGEHLSINPMEIHNIYIGMVQLIWPGRWQNSNRVGCTVSCLKPLPKYVPYRWP
jgi:hypothetical protein